MAKSDLFEPKQKRSIEKKKHIIKTGLELMMENGYYHTTTDDIALASGVSTGIIYRYFRDKHDILIAGLSLAFDTMYETDGFEVLEHFDDIRGFVENMFAYFIKLHFENKNMHEELEAMRHADEEVASLYREKEMIIVKKVTKQLKENGYNQEDLPERTYTVFHLIEGYCHLQMQNDTPEINLDKMKKIAIDTACNLLVPEERNK